MRNNLIILAAFIFAVKAFGYEYNVQRYNETLISFNHAVLGVNCTPNSFGAVDSITGPQSTSQGYFLKLIPTGKKGKYRRAHWGDPNAKVTGKSGNTKRKKSFRARHNCKTCKLKNGAKRYYSNQCLACRDW